MLRFFSSSSFFRVLQLGDEWVGGGGKKDLIGFLSAAPSNTEKMEPYILYAGSTQNGDKKKILLVAGRIHNLNSII